MHRPHIVVAAAVGAMVLLPCGPATASPATAPVAAVSLATFRPTGSLDAARAQTVVAVTEAFASLPPAAREHLPQILKNIAIGVL